MMKRLTLLLVCVLVSTPPVLAQDVGQFFDSDGARIHYTDRGEGTAVLWPYS